MEYQERKPRIALFVESHEGYGHFNIISQLARQLEAQGAEVMVLSGTLNYAGAGQTFDFGTARLVNLPTVDYRITSKGSWEFMTPDGQLYSDNPEYIASRQEIIKNALVDFKPNEIVTEFYPFSQSFRTCLKSF